MVWTKDKLYLLALFVLLIIFIILTLYFNQKSSANKETFDIQNKRICILYTGGVGIKKNNPGQLKRYLPTLTNKYKVAPYNIIEYSPLLNSSNVSPVEWVDIASSIGKVYNKYDAFVVIHGRDTITYTASALAFMFENLNKPVILTDGKDNLITSLLLATQYSIPEVLICYGKQIIRGCRSKKLSEGIHSPNHPLLGKCNKTKIILNNKLILKQPKQPLQILPIDTNKKVIIVKLFPGIDSKYLDKVIKGGVDGIILEIYGNPTKKDLLMKLKEIVENGIIVISVSQNSKHGVMLKKSGVISGKDMTTETALAKLYFILSNVENPEYEMIKKLIVFNMRGEVS